MTEPSSESRGAKSLGFVGYLIGVVLGSYTGTQLIAPVLTTGVVWLIGSRLITPDAKETLPAFGFNAGHFLWFGLGAALLPSPVSVAMCVELAMYALGLAWLLATRRPGPLYFLGTYQLLALGANCRSLVEATIGTDQHRALLVHILWRTLALYFMVKLLLARRGQTRADTPPIE